MKIAQNNCGAIRDFFHQNLGDVYDSNEIDSSFFIVMEHCFGMQKADVLTISTARFTESQLLKINNIVKALKKGKPLAYVLGEWEFYGLKFSVNPSVLIPRPETEELVQLILTENSQNDKLKVLDIGTGTGCIAIALKANLPHAQVSAYDISEEALKMAQKNASNNAVDVHFKQVDILNATTKKETQDFDIIVSNPPYIPLHQKNEMHGNVLEYEPHLALFVSDEEPFIFYESTADFAMINLKSGGSIYFEINAFYGKEVVALLEKKGFKDVILIQDLNGKDRFVSAVK